MRFRANDFREPIGTSGCFERELSVVFLNIVYSALLMRINGSFRFVNGRCDFVNMKTRAMVCSSFTFRKELSQLNLLGVPKRFMERKVELAWQMERVYS
ncbi:hypothetical protein DLM77_15030 [Leptospira yasudae]|uniref:Uncharacterized protein n=1 Tax=Leptospira yasudae TaxID=2202201 RepID=A0ABX9M1K7_9LEPT|nr:hypothetical protein DLM77_15030 [Leptospira yasudae]